MTSPNIWMLAMNGEKKKPIPQSNVLEQSYIDNGWYLLWMKRKLGKIKIVLTSKTHEQAEEHRVEETKANSQHILVNHSRHREDWQHRRSPKPVGEQL